MCVCVCVCVDQRHILSIVIHEIRLGDSGTVLVIKIVVIAWFCFGSHSSFSDL